MILSQIIKAYCSIGKRKVIAHLAVGGESTNFDHLLLWLKISAGQCKTAFFQNK